MKNDKKHFRIRLTPEVHKKVRLAAAEEEKTMQAYLEKMITDVMQFNDLTVKTQKGHL